MNVDDATPMSIEEGVAILKNLMLYGQCACGAPRTVITTTEETRPGVTSKTMSLVCTADPSHEQ